MSLSRDPLGFLRRCARDHGDLVPLRFVWKPVLFVNHPDDVARVLSTNHRKVVKDFARRADRALFGDGISLREGDSWLRGRRTMQPSFHRDHLPAYAEAVVTLSERATRSWRDGETRNLRDEMSNLTGAIIARTLFGVEERDDEAKLVDVLARALDCRNVRVRSVELLIPEHVPTPTNLRLRRARHDIDARLDHLIDARRVASQTRLDLLAALLQARDEAGRGLTDQLIKDEIVTMFVGGTETVTDLLSWAWYLLSQHPEVENRFLAELDAVLGDRPPTFTDLPRLPYLERTVTESLRLYPPASVLDRRATTELDLGGYRVAAGTEIVVSPWVIQRDPRFFADPERFDPDRWADGLAERLPRYAYYPFGGGPRLCIGRSFATMEASLVLATIAQRYRLALLPGLRVTPEPIPTLRPKSGLPMVVQVRSRAGVRR